MPSVVPVSGDDFPPGGLRIIMGPRFWCRIFTKHPANRGRAQMKPGTCQRLSDLGLAHGWTQGLQSLDDVADEIWEPIHRRSHLDQGIRTFLVQPVKPRSNGGRRDVKHAGCLLQ